MEKTRLSLWYLATYLMVGGVGLFVMPTLALQLLFASGDYGEVMPRVAGMLMIGLSLVVIQVIRHSIMTLYPTTLLIRAFFLIGFSYLYFLTQDPFFIALLVIVGIGFVLTASSYFREKSG